MFEVKKYSASMETSDRVRLDADIYQPDSTTEKFPVLLMRQPYGRAIASTVVYAHPSWYAAFGYIVVVQDVRGMGTSQGEFELFAKEIDDGFETVNWAATLPGSNGKVGMYGFSYQGMTQLYAALKKPPALKVICPAMLAFDLYHDWAYEGGAFCFQANLAWAMQLAAIKASFRGEERKYQQLYAATRNLPLFDPIPASPEILSDLAPESFYHIWLNRSNPDDQYWRKLSPKYFIENIDLPMVHIGGWFDPTLRGTLNLYKYMAANSKLPQHLIVGPWPHLPWGRKVGTLDYGPEAVSPVDALQIKWFDRFLKEEDNGILTEKPVRLFEMGSNRWRYFDTYPNSSPQAFYLKSNGLANIDDSDGQLREQFSEILPSEDLIVSDPWRPVPSLGGHSAFPSGSSERSAIDCRTDVLTYTSHPIEADLHLAGDILLEIYCRTDSPSFDLCAILSEVYPNGKVYNFTQGYLRYSTDTNKQDSLKLVLQPTCANITRGNCLRLSLSGANFPAYSVNPGTLTPANIAKLMEAKVITLKISSGGDSSSRILLPLV